MLYGEWIYGRMPIMPRSSYLWNLFIRKWVTQWLVRIFTMVSVYTRINKRKAKNSTCGHCSGTKAHKYFCLQTILFPKRSDGQNFDFVCTLSTGWHTRLQSPFSHKLTCGCLSKIVEQVRFVNRGVTVMLTSKWQDYEWHGFSHFPL